MSDFPGLNAELDRIAETHMALTSPATANVVSSEQGAGMLMYRRPVLLHADVDDNEIVVQLVTEGLSDIPDDEEADLIKAYRDDYRGLIGQLQVAHASIGHTDKAEEAVLQNTVLQMVEEDFHLLGGYIVGRAEPEGQIIGSMFYHKIFSKMYMQGLLTAVEMSDLDTSQLAPIERERIEAIQRQETTPETIQATAMFIASLMPAALIAFPDGKEPAGH